MKIRVKVRASGSRHSVTVDAPEEGEPTLEHVKTAIFRQIPALPDVDNADSLVLSLNGMSPMQNADEDSVSDMGLVSGDLVHVLNGPPPANASQSSLPSVAASQSQPVVAASSSAQSSATVASVRSRSSRAEDVSRWARRCTQEGESGPSSSSGSISIDAESHQSLLLSGSYTALTAEERRSHLATFTSCAEYVEGATLPSLLQRFYDAGRPETKVELVFALVYVIFLEKNFTLVERSAAGSSTANLDASGSADSITGATSSLPLDWKQKVANKIELTFRHPKCGSGVEFIVTFINLFGSSIVVQAKAQATDTGDESSSLKVQFKPDDFLTPQNSSTTRDGSNLYRHLRRFSTLLLDSVVNGVLSDGLGLVGLDVEDVSIFSLPYDCSIKIMTLLDFRSLARLSCVNKFFRDYCDSAQFLWNVSY